MKAVSSMVRAMWMAAAVAAALALGVCGVASAAGSSAAAAVYDLTVIVYAPDVGPAQVAISYPKVVDHAAIQKGLGELAQRTGAVISDAKIRDARQGRGMSATATAVEFVAVGLIQQAQGALPVGAIIRSLPEWQRMRLVFVVGAAFPWTGPGTSTADGFAVRVVGSMKPVEYDVERKSGRVAAPAVMPPQKPASSAALPAALIGLPAGFLIGWLGTGARQRSRPPASRA